MHYQYAEKRKDFSGSVEEDLFYHTDCFDVDATASIRRQANRGRHGFRIFKFL
jgi:hypothetical protein